MSLGFEEARQQIIYSGRRLDALGLAAATSGNFSVRLTDGSIAMTVSGRHKGRLGPDDIMRVDPEGRALEDKRPSAETALHTVIYSRIPQARAVLHVHSVAGVVLTRHLASAGELTLDGYEMLKAFPGITTHDTTARIPIYDNTQDVPALAGRVAAWLCSNPAAPAFLIRGHGAYGWGVNLEEAERIIEALEHLMRCEFEALRLRGGIA